MNARPDNPSAVQIRPPQLIQSLTAGFNMVTNNIALILLPIALDLLLWFGPHLRMKTLFEPLLADMFKLIRQPSMLEMRPFWDNMEKFLNLFLNQFNLVSTLSTFPIGVPAMMAAKSPLNTPLGAAPIVEIRSEVQIILLWLGLNLAGLGLGTLYFAWVAQGCSRTMVPTDCGENANTRGFAGKIPPFRPGVLAWQAVQVLAMVIIFFLIGVVTIFPAVMVASTLIYVSPFLFQAAMFMIMFVVVWFLVPLAFSLHGIFLCGQSVINAMLTSARVVRFSLPGTGMFLLMIIVLYQGMGVLWHVPPDNSWLMLMGIFGHAFIATGLLAASFVYYRGGLAYVQALRNISLNRRGLR